MMADRDYDARQRGANDRSNSYITAEEWATRSYTGTCSSPECPLTRAHSGPCAPQPTRGVQLKEGFSKTEHTLELNAVIACIESPEIPTEMRWHLTNPDGVPMVREQVDLDVVVQTVLNAAVPALLDRVRELEAERDAALSTIAKVRELHREAYGERAEVVCAECTRINRYGLVIYPCQTIRALGYVPSTGEGNE